MCAPFSSQIFASVSLKMRKYGNCFESTVHNGISLIVIQTTLPHNLKEYVNGTSFIGKTVKKWRGRKRERCTCEMCEREKEKEKEL